MVLLTTANVPPRERFDYWRQLFASRALPCRMEPAREPTLHGEVQAEAIGDLTLSKYTGGVVDRYVRGRAEIARSSIPFYFAHLHLQGSGFFLRGDEEVAISAGDILVADTVHEFQMGFPARPSIALVARFPKEWIAPRTRRPDCVHGTLIRRDDPLAALLRSYLLNGFESADRLTPDAKALFLEHSAELLSQGLAENIANEPRSSHAWREALFVRACRLMALQYSDHELGPNEIARKLGVSTRLLQKVFREHGETIAQLLWSERLSQAAKLLAAPDAAQRSITDIAFTCGFSDSAHFARAFAARMGMPPSAWRKRAQ